MPKRLVVAGVNIAEAKEFEFQKATQRVYRSKDRSSRLVVQVLP